MTIAQEYMTINEALENLEEYVESVIDGADVGCDSYPWHIGKSISGKTVLCIFDAQNDLSDHHKEKMKTLLGVDGISVEMFK